ncbi:MAG: hypothetical protein ACYCVZ_08020, partial [Streptosporangiaceae bacterium]
TAPADPGEVPPAGRLLAGRHPALSRRPDEAGPDTLLVCDSVPAAMATGLPPARLVVTATPADLTAVTGAGLAACVDADLRPFTGPVLGAGPDQDIDHGAGQGGSAGADQIAGSAATAALATWLGAVLISTRHPIAVRRAIDMTAAIAGWRRPARTVRGLA